MRHEILIRADGESSASLRNLIKDELPDGVRVQDSRPQRAGFGAPDLQTLSLVLDSTTSVLTSLISVVGVIWAARIAARGKSERTNLATVPVVVISTQTADIRIPLHPDVSSALATAQVPNDPHQIVEIRLEAMQGRAP